ncbi:putative F-box protein At1g32420 [Coffea arabica]|uniref:F-box protein At1g32420 n=1 Tax=Coffea arabica TaxID=13443 RepID=A0A6P6V8G8_COFAR|nr:putative F-box protein At5g62660 [Coffea arabica]
MIQIKRTLVPAIPDDILVQILEKLPAKPLLRFKSVSKSWYSIIEDQEFADGFRLRSHNRGTNLLVRKIRFGKRTVEGQNTRVYDFSVIDSEGQSVPVAVPNILKNTFFHLDQPVEGLVLCNNLIWNPTTGKFIDLPPRNPNPYAKEISEKMGNMRGCYHSGAWSKYFLGFDVSSKKYKVLSICLTWLERKPIRANNDDIFYKEFDINENQVHVHAEVLTLGTNSWKILSIDYSVQQDLSKGFTVKTSCSINGAIYSIITPHSKLSVMSSSESECILAFDLSHEKFQLLLLPRRVYVDFAGEIGGRLAIIDVYGERIWMLEEAFEGGKWTAVDLFLAKSWARMKLSEGRLIAVYPIGSCQNGEILFRVSEIVSSSGQELGSTIFGYNMESKDVRMVTKLDDFVDDRDNIVSGLVETIHPLN